MAEDGVSRVHIDCLPSPAGLDTLNAQEIAPRYAGPPTPYDMLAVGELALAQGRPPSRGYPKMAPRAGDRQKLSARAPARARPDGATRRSDERPVLLAAASTRWPASRALGCAPAWAFGCTAPAR